MALYHGLISFHMQEPAPDWTRAAAALPAGTVLKSVSDIGLLVEAQRVNPGIIPCLRRWVDQEPLHHQVYDNAPPAMKRERARNFFELFINNPALRSLDNLLISLWHDVYAASHTPTETQDRVEQEQAFSYVWLNDYAQRLPGATLVLSSAGMGNDIPIEVAALADENGYFLDYHAYILTAAGSPVAGEWDNFSGRWTRMDEGYRAAGYQVKWLFGEGGPIGRNAQGGAAPASGWRHRECCNGDPIKYINIMSYWAERTRNWNGQHGRRAHAVNVFTTRRPGAPGETSWFLTVQPEMDSLAALAQRYAETAAEAEPEPETTPAGGTNGAGDTGGAATTDDSGPAVSAAPSGAQELIVVAPAGAAIRRADGTLVGALPVDTRFWGAPVTIGGELRYALRGTVSADPSIVRPVAGPPPPTLVQPLSGVDVSFWQGTIDWRLMKEMGVRVAAIKVSEGTEYVDGQWRHNHQWARAYGIKVFPYHFFHNQKNAEQQAAHFRGQYAQVIWDYPPAGDFEDRTGAQTQGDRIQSFMLNSGSGVVYTNASWWNQYVGPVGWAGGYRLWVAHWDSEQPELPAGWSEWWGWQYRVTDDALRYGVQSDHLDLDWFYEIEAVTGALLSHWPVAGRSLSLGGNTWNNPAGHEAVDLAAVRGEPVYAAGPGVVKQIGYQTGGYGRYVVIQHAGDVETLYAHLTSQPVLVGTDDPVAGGQQLGTVGMTGMTSGPHLHFEVRLASGRVDPWPLLSAIP